MKCQVPILIITIDVPIAWPNDLYQTSFLAHDKHRCLSFLIGWPLHGIAPKRLVARAEHKAKVFMTRRLSQPKVASIDLQQTQTFHRAYGWKQWKCTKLRIKNKQEANKQNKRKKELKMYYIHKYIYKERGYMPLEVCVQKGRRMKRKRKKFHAALMRLKR